ncbi:putative pentatricopeptide repeat protein [Eutypa lata UCREL1]|uniref:Putative pentatricopeptide repeat protein n=1 Tax=Eutypa lata (strain UCR-EL1) TaxID=1287681 RepID=M7SI86_EUTLA|nr:putative pentatricopeptide repeat protein [Eutypa lata UCREL1]
MQQIASRFAKSSAHKLQAADVICSLTDIPGFDINLPAPASVCTSLLTLDVSDSIPEGQAEPDELFKLLLEHGFRPNLLALTALMHPHVFSILLNGSKHAFDIPSVRKIIEMVFSRDAWTGIIVDDFIDLMFRENEARPLQKFFTSPLENVIAERGVVPRNATLITDLADALRPLPDHLLFKPTSHTLLLLLAAHVRSINNPSKVIRQYRHFNQLIKSRDSVATQLIADKGTKIYDIFLRAMMQFRESLKAPMSIIYNMMTSAEREKKHTGRNIYHPFPSVHTWTILLNGFKNHKHIRGAVNVLNMMIQLGNVQPNLVTWNALINAFAQVGDVQGAVRTMALLEQGGLSSDDRTVEAFNAFSRARREKAIQLLEEARKEPVNNFGDPGTVLGDGGGGGNGMVRSGIHFPRRSWESSDFSTDRHPRDPRSGPLDGGGGAPPLEPSLAQRLARARKDWDRDAADIVQRSDLPFP